VKPLAKDEYLALLPILLSMSAFGLYNWKLFSGQLSPNAASWAVWAFVTVLNFTSYKSMTGDWWKALLPTANSLLCVLTFAILAVWGSFAPVNAYDHVAFLLGMTAGTIWGLTKSSKNAQIILSLAIAIGFIPTYASVWKNPEGELFLAWFLWSVMFLVHASVVRLRWRGQKMDLLYPINGFVLHFAVAVLALR